MKKGVILTTTTDFREKVVLELQSFPRNNRLNQISKDGLVLLYNSQSQRYYARARYVEQIELSQQELEQQSIKYSYASDPTWEYNVILTDFQVLDKKFTKEELNNIVMENGTSDNLPLIKGRGIDYIDEDRVAILEKYLA